MNMMRHPRVLATVAALLAAGPAMALDVTFNKIADTGTPVPSGSGAFSHFNSENAVVSNGNVAFRGEGVNQNPGVYFFSGSTLSTSKVVAAGENMPGLPGVNFQFFFDISLSGNTVGFAGYGRDASNTLVSAAFTSTNGQLANRADSNTNNPSDASYPFSYFDAVAASGGDVAFYAHGRNANDRLIAGIYTNAGGPVTKVVDNRSPVPGANMPNWEFTSFRQAVAFGGGSIGIAAKASDFDFNERANVLLVATPGGALTNIADTRNTISPSTRLRFGRLLSTPSVDGTKYAFAGSSDDVDGIYTNITGSLSIVADENTPVPGQATLAFDRFNDDQISIDGSRIVFKGFFGKDPENPESGSTGHGLYLYDNGALSLLVDTTKPFDGKSIADVSVSFDGAIDGDTIAFVAHFRDGTKGVYTAVVPTAVVPEPASLSLLALTGTVLLRRRGGPAVR
jgi:hypothetical protein